MKFEYYMKVNACLMTKSITQRPEACTIYIFCENIAANINLKIEESQLWILLKL